MTLKVLKDHTGVRIGKVVVLRRVPTVVRVAATGQEVKPRLAWVCRCDCGHEWEVPHARITTASPASCNSCADRTPKLKLPKSAHQKKSHPSYGSWYAMLRRCTSPKHENYHRYGGRGIKVCKAWFDFDRFVADMGIRPPGHTIDRKDNDKGYNKHNCRWATPAQQRANQRHKPKN